MIYHWILNQSYTMGAENTHPSGEHSVLSGIRVAQSSDFV